MFSSGVSGVRLGQIEDSTTDYLAQGKQVRLLYLLLLLVRISVLLVNSLSFESYFICVVAR